ncbi:MAG TPA: hypothetical protein VFJ58_20230 [Armatimonadota bacterium]|nr:hypothetical protein [Armatimonadota bacterium]
MSAPVRPENPESSRPTSARTLLRASGYLTRRLPIAALGVGGGIAAAALCFQSLAVADPPVPGAPAPAAGAVVGQPEGAEPSHIPPVLVGRIDQIAPGAASFQVMTPNRPLLAAGPVNVVTRSYTRVYRLSVIDPGTLQHGDSVLIQGKADPDAKTFQAARVFRTVVTVPLAPGIDLLDSAPAATGSNQNGADAFGSLGAAVKGNSVPASANSPDLKSKLALRAQKRINQALKRGNLAGLVVSANPLVVEMYTGETIPVSLQPQNVTIDQVAMHLGDLTDGAAVQVKGSEIAPGIFRAQEIDVLPPNLPRAELRNRAALRRQMRLRRRRAQRQRNRPALTPNN